MKKVLINIEKQQTHDKDKLAGLLFGCKNRPERRWDIRLLWSKVINHSVAFKAIKEEEVPVWSISLGQSLKRETQVDFFLHQTKAELL